jgi:hypothetical protein
MGSGWYLVHWLPITKIPWTAIAWATWTIAEVVRRQTNSESPPGSLTYFNYLNPFSGLSLLAQLTGMLLAVSDIRTRINHPGTFPIRYKFCSSFGRILEEGTEGKNTQNIFCSTRCLYSYWNWTSCYQSQTRTNLYWKTTRYTLGSFWSRWNNGIF